MIVCDACSLINLERGGLLTLGLDLPCSGFCVGRIVLSELEAQPDHRFPWLERCVLIDRDVDSAELVATLAAQKLGAGESECLMLARRDNYSVLSDDRRARGICQKELGAERVVGSIAWLAHLVRNGALTRDQSLGRYRAMLAAGAYLPRFADQEFLRKIDEDAVQWRCAGACVQGKHRV